MDVFLRISLSREFGPLGRPEQDAAGARFRDRLGARERAPEISDQTLGVASISAQARATSVSAVLLPGIRAKPLFSTRLPRSQVLALVSSASLAGASPCARKRSTQIGARAATAASCAAEADCLLEVPPVTQPPQEK